MDDVENSDERKDEEVFDVEIVETDDDDHADAPDAMAADQVEAPVDAVDPAETQEDDRAADALDAIAAGQAEAPVDAIEAAEGRQDDQAEDALGAMAAGQVEAPVDAIEAAEARQDGQAEDALASLASGEPAGQEPQGQDRRDPAEEFDFAEGEHIHVDPERARASRKQHQRLADNAQSLSFKKTMTPLLLVVGVLLLAISGITGALKGDPDAVDATMMDKYGTPMMLAALLLGLVLLAGAVLYHMEIRRAQNQDDQQGR